MQNCRKHSFVQIYGQLTIDQITLERKYLWDVIKIVWGEVFEYSYLYQLRFQSEINTG